MPLFHISTKEKYWIKPTYGSVNVDKTMTGAEILDTKESISILTKNGYTPIKSKAFLGDCLFYNVKTISYDGYRYAILHKDVRLEDFDIGKVMILDEIKNYERDFSCVVISGLLRNCSGLHFNLSQVVINKTCFDVKETGCAVLETDSDNIVTELGLVCYVNL